MTFYLGVVDRAADGSWGVWFPDLPGCYSAGSTMDDLFTHSIEAVRLWSADAIAEDAGIPPARDHTALMSDERTREALEEAGPTGCLIQIPLMLDRGRNTRANISIDANLLEAIDAASKQRGLTRSGFLASAARDKIQRGD